VRKPKVKQIVDALKVSAPAQLMSSTRLVDFINQNRTGKKPVTSSPVIVVVDGNENIRAALLYSVTDKEVQAYFVVVPKTSLNLQETVVDRLFDAHALEDVPEGTGFKYVGYVFSNVIFDLTILASRWRSVLLWK